MAEPLPLLIPHPALTHGRTQYALAKDEVNYVGEAVAIVVAEDRYIAEDAVARIGSTTSLLPAGGRRGGRTPRRPCPRRRARQCPPDRAVRPGARRIAAAPHRLSSDLTTSAARACRWRAAARSRWDLDQGRPGWTSTQTSTGVRAAHRREDGPRPRPGRRDHPDVGGGFG